MSKCLIDTLKRDVHGLQGIYVDFDCWICKINTITKLSPTHLCKTIEIYEEPQNEEYENVNGVDFQRLPKNIECNKIVLKITNVDDVSLLSIKIKKGNGKQMNNVIQYIKSKL